MAMADYYLCDRCDNKTFYDANLDYQQNEQGNWCLPRVGDMAVLCEACVKTHEIIVIERRY